MVTLHPNKDIETTIVQQGNLKISENVFTPESAGTDNIDFTVPSGKKWILKALVLQSVSFVGTFSNIRLQNIIDSNTIQIGYYEDKDYSLVLNNDLTFKEGDDIRFRISTSAYTSGSLKCSILYLEIDA